MSRSSLSLPPLLALDCCLPPDSAAILAADPPSRAATVTFRLYDVDEDGFISFDDLSSVLRLMVGTFMPDDEVATIARRTIEEADVLDRDGRISLAEFGGVLRNIDMDSKLGVAF